MINVGVIGLGAMGRVHLDAYTASPHAAVTHVCDIDTATAAELAPTSTPGCRTPSRRSPPIPVSTWSASASRTGCTPRRPSCCSKPQGRHAGEGRWRSISTRPRSY